ncbi:hypothetical protein ABMB44_12530 [Levilactobacillus brevis]
MCGPYSGGQSFQRQPLFSTCIFNGLKGLYTRVGRYYFSNPEARKLALAFYSKLSTLCHEKLYDQVMDTVRSYGKDSGAIWQSMQGTMPSDLTEARR